MRRLYHLRMDLGLKGRIVLITGGSKGLGLACARAFIAEGARVAIVSRSHDNLEKARRELGTVATPTHIGGGAANAALMLATAGLANAYAKSGVRVVGVNPGPTKTERVAQGLAADAKRDGVSEDEALKRIVQRMPLGRMPEPEEIADIVVFAASERARLLTGAILSADGATTPTVV